MPFRLDGSEVHFRGTVVRLAAAHATVAFREVGNSTSSWNVEYGRMFEFTALTA